MERQNLGLKPGLLLGTSPSCGGSWNLQENAGHGSLEGSLEEVSIE